MIKLLIFLIAALNVHAQDPNWGQDFKFPASKYKGLTSSNRLNINNFKKNQFEQSVIDGSKHVLIYPVQTTQLLLPYNSLLKYFQSVPSSRIRKYVYQIAQKITGVEEIGDFFSLIGTVPYPKNLNEIGPNRIHDLPEELKKYPMGTTIIENEYGKGLTFSCAACHSADLFGVKVIGLTNRFPRSNEFFVLGKKAARLTNSAQYKLLFGATDSEARMMKASIKATKYIGAKKPLTLGLDTSLRQTALSLSRRAPDKYATKKYHYTLFPRRNELDHQSADSKPSVWWNLKYKTRWLADGSIVSGNPVHTNLLWNEIGRGADLKKLSEWMRDNKKIVTDLTGYVFQTKAPEYLDFFPNSIDLTKAQKGEKLFIKTCAKCHGIYEKGWSNTNLKDYRALMKTTTVYYHQKTPVVDVKTDPARYLGMKAFYKDLNRLEISKQMKTVVTPQKGYVPPPLVGIWSRWPYFHNNSVPNLCELLTPSKSRIKYYIAGPAINKKTDYDQECAGYPYPNYVPKEWRANQNFYFDNTIPGLQNSGHSKMLLNKDQTEKFSKEQKLEIIEFLKTL